MSREATLSSVNLLAVEWVEGGAALGFGLQEFKCSRVQVRGWRTAVGGSERFAVLFNYSTSLSLCYLTCIMEKCPLNKLVKCLHEENSTVLAAKLSSVLRGGLWKVFGGGRGVASVPGQMGGTPEASEPGAGRVAGKPSSSPSRRTLALAETGLRGVGRGERAEALRSLGRRWARRSVSDLRPALPLPPLGGLSAPTSRALARASGPLPASAPPALAALPLQNWAAPGPGRKCPPDPPSPASHGGH